MRIIEDISDFIFLDDPIRKADVIFIPGGSYPEAAEEAAYLWKQGIAPVVVPSGMYSIKLGVFAGVKSKKHIYTGEYRTECEFLTDVLMKNGVEPDAIVGEDKSTFTKENAVFSKQLLDRKNLTVKKAVICCKNFHARRCLMYYQLAFPDTEFMVHPVIFYEHGEPVNKQNWFRSQQGVRRVLGEVERIGTQFLDAFSQIEDDVIKK